MLKVISSFICQSASDERHTWTAMSYCYIIGNPDHVWDGVLYYNGKNPPKKVEVKMNDEGFYECESFGMIEETTDEETNATRILLNLLSFQSPFKHGYDFMAFGERVKNQKIEIRWEENGQKMESTITIGK